MTQAEVFDAIKLQITSRYKNKPLCIAINGIEGSGKTIFAGHLTQYLNSKQCNAMHISIDGFHYDRVHRYRQGKDSALGYYEDSYDENAFVQKKCFCCPRGISLPV